ncbi:tRNA lysidine(34) synthetase TilS [Zhihengliuella flava]|uniref:tRNA(Ile)-lysidine synthase n=1 Tax=Zhihengliuella flava TaxID=1285193 RepID=A0A931DA40_9MICC|nr:tRNA lysidine(34) synthetase TilS [Zhihengliuella flava]MBG6084793.1 tRNA(Ile)-lysidine synthase [Zhihengliuella flava]
MGGHLPPCVASARRGVLAALAGWSADGCPGSGVEDDDASAGAAPHVLLAVSGGADSLALAAAAAFLASTAQVEACALIVDHGLQAGSAEAAATAAEQVRGLGLSARVVEAQIADPGTEEQAREARYAALEAAARRWEEESSRPVAILTGHTLSDQAEQVLLGLARGSGTRALAGIPAARGRILRPFLGGAPGTEDGVWRADTEAICAHAGLTPWQDPTNAERVAARNRIRLDVLPYLESTLGPGVDAALARTARLAAADADYLDAEASRAYGELVLTGTDAVVLRLEGVRALAAPLRRRVLRQAALAAGGLSPTYERTVALERLCAAGGSAGPVQLAGHVEAFRVRDGAAYGHRAPVLVLRAAR